MITYTVAEYTSEETSVEVTFTNAEGLVHKRNVNIPRDASGSVDEEAFNDILEGQLRGVENKLKVGVVTFIDPNEIVTDTTETTEEPAA
jgi:hypothetical protein